MLTSQSRARPPAWAQPRTRKLGVLVALALLAGLLLYRGGWTVSRHQEAAANAVVATGAALSPASLGTRGDVAVRDDGAITPQRPPSLRRDFEAATDLYAFAQRLAPAVQAKEPDAIWMLSRVYDYCAGYAVAPAAYAKDTQVFGDMGLRTSAALVTARNRVSRRCARFVPEDDLSYRAILLQRVEAAEAGSLAAEAALLAMGKPLKSDDPYKHALVERVQQSKDPEAYAALSPGMGIAANGRSAFSEQVAGTQFAELAWQLAACRLGLDCGPEGALMTNYCANGGICSRDAGQDFPSFVYDAAVPRQGADVVNDMVTSLLGEERVMK
ncbi:hypothetical protein ACFOLC_04745 [Lysobacter cavernae]|uniref:Sel1 repeat family protein n=1 Tax=Lysobacter cavernae TaxID=1685901 RepID=A0ABV7RNJ3_9GAMM